MIGARDLGFLRGAPIVFASSFKLANHVLGDRDRRSLTGIMPHDVVNEGVAYAIPFFVRVRGHTCAKEKFFFGGYGPKKNFSLACISCMHWIRGRQIQSQIKVFWERTWTGPLLCGIPDAAPDMQDPAAGFCISRCFAIEEKLLAVN